MSLIFGIINFDGKPAAEALQKMYEAVAHFPHQKFDFLAQTNVGFGFMLTYNTPEAIYETMPRYMPEQRLYFVAQGRLDNRAEIAQKLNIRLNEELSDGELMLQAYLKWGQETPNKLLGDWSFVGFDATCQQAFMARDHHGYTALYYFVSNNALVFSSSIKAILAAGNYTPKINTKALIRNQSFWMGDTDHTFYEDIYNLLPAHQLRLQNGTISKKRYWFPQDIQPIVRKNRADYTEELSAILYDAVKVRLRSHRPVASMLSGGLDSSTVSYMAAQILSQQQTKLTTFSHVPLYKSELSNHVLNATKVLDETPFINATATGSDNIDSVLLDSKQVSVIDGILKMIDVNNLVIHAAGNAFWLADISQTAQMGDFGTLLTGENGNATISYTGIYDLLPWHHTSFRNNPKQFIKTKVLKPVMLKYLSKFYEKRMKLNSHFLLEYSYLNKEQIDKWDLVNAIRESSPHTVHNQSAKDGMLHILELGAIARCMFGANQSNYFGVENRDPTADKRVIEFCLSVPNEIFFDQHGKNRQLVKQLMKNKLPDKVLFEKRKGLQSSDIQYRVLAEQKQTDDLLDKITKNTTFIEMMDIEKLQADWKKIKANQTSILQVQAFLKALSVGCFLEMASLKEQVSNP